jgi:hypothetical protein
MPYKEICHVKNIKSSGIRPLGGNHQHENARRCAAMNPVAFVHQISPCRICFPLTAGARTLKVALKSVNQGVHDVSRVAETYNSEIVMSGAGQTTKRGDDRGGPEEGGDGR